MKARLPLRALGALVTVAGLGAAGAAWAGDNYIGAARCKSCHEFEYQMWAKGPHATAHKSLTEQQLKDAKCSTCHTMLPEALTERFVGVQCERCHGAGRYYHPEYVMKDRELARAVGLVDVTAVHCQQCHTEGTPSVEPFDFVRMWAEIDHGREARKLWEAAQKQAQSNPNAAPDPQAAASVAGAH